MATVTAGTSASFTVAAGAQLFVTTSGSAVVESLAAPAGNSAIRQVVTGQTVILGPWPSDATFKVTATTGSARYANDVRYASDGTATGGDGPFDGDGRADGSQWNAGGVVYVKRGGGYALTPASSQAAEFRQAFGIGQQYTMLSSVPGLVAFWDFSEATGLAKVAKAGPRGFRLQDGGGSAVATISNDGPFSGSCASFDGVDDYLIIPAAQVAELNAALAGNEVSVLVMTKVEKQDGAQFFTGMWQESNADPRRQYGLFYGLSLYGGARRGCGHISKTGGASPGLPYSRDLSAQKSFVALNRWCALGMTYDGNEIRSYYDGRFESRPTFTEPGPPNGEGLTYSKNPYIFPLGLNDGVKLSDFTVGACLLTSGFANWLQGRIAGIAVFNRKLSQRDIFKFQMQAASASFPFMIYRFVEFDTGNRPVDDCAMKTYQGSTAVDKSTVTANEDGFRFVTSGSQKFLNRNQLSTGPCVWVDEQDFGVDLEEIRRITVTTNNESTADAIRLCVKVGGQWYASDSTFAQTVAAISGSDWANAETKTLTLYGVTWLALDLRPGVALSLGSTSVPSGELQGVGIYSGGQTVGNLRLRDLSLFAL